MPTLTKDLQWTPDCQGKWDYDGGIISVETRYWPRGGSMTIYQAGQFVSDQHSPERQHIRPSAKSTIYFNGYWDTPLTTKEFEAETEEEVKESVRNWVEHEAQRILRQLIGLSYNMPTDE